MSNPNNFKLAQKDINLLYEAILLLDLYGSKKQQQCPFNLDYIFTQMKIYSVQDKPEKQVEKLNTAIKRILELKSLVAKIITTYGSTHKVEGRFHPAPNQNKPVKEVEIVKKDASNMAHKINLIVIRMKIKLMLHKAISTLDFVAEKIKL